MEETSRRRSSRHPLIVFDAGLDHENAQTPQQADVIPEQLREGLGQDATPSQDAGGAADGIGNDQRYQHKKCHNSAASVQPIVLNLDFDASESTTDVAPEPEAQEAMGLADVVHRPRAPDSDGSSSSDEANMPSPEIEGKRKREEPTLHLRQPDQHRRRDMSPDHHSEIASNAVTASALTEPDRRAQAWAEPAAKPPDDNSQNDKPPLTEMVEMQHTDSLGINKQGAVTVVDPPSGDLETTQQKPTAADAVQPRMQTTSFLTSSSTSMTSLTSIAPTTTEKENNPERMAARRSRLIAILSIGVAVAALLMAAAGIGAMHCRLNDLSRDVDSLKMQLAELQAVNTSGAGGSTDTSGTSTTQGGVDTVDTTASLSTLPTPTGQLSPKLYAIGGMWQGNTLNTVTAFDGTKWQSVAPLPDPLEAVAAVTFRNKLFVLGGISQGPNSAEVDLVFAFDGTAWTLAPPLSRARAKAAAVVFRDRLYIIGGRGSGTADTMEMFDGTSWAFGTGIGQPRFAASVAVFQDAIYLIGGTAQGGGRLDSVEYFDGAAWNDGPSLATARGNAAAATFQEKLYVFGGVLPGITDTPSVEVFDGKAWSPGPAMNHKRRAHGVAVFLGTLYVVGGTVDQPETVETFDGDTWSTSLYPLPDARMELAVAVF